MRCFQRRPMGRVLRRALALALVAAPLCLARSQAASAQRCEGVTMAPRIEVDGRPLVLNGMGVREATVFNVDVYVAGLYLERPTRDAESVLRDMKRMRIDLRLVRDVERGEMNEAIRNGFERNAGNRLPIFRARIRRLEQMIPDLHDKDQVSFTYRPEGRGALVLHVNGRPRGQIQGEEFARTFFSIWLGDHPPNAGLKRGLLGGRC